jgi:MFS family permease
MMPPRQDLAPLPLGLAANWRQFWLLVLVNAFVGAMVGLERTVPPLIAEREFGLTSTTVAMLFVVSFGVVKATTNLFAGRLSDQYGRRPVLLAGWLFGLPVPFLLMWAPAWSWIIVANILLGINQGLTWSTTIIMKIDLVGPKRRGFAMGLNEAAGYLAVAASAYLSGRIAGTYGLRPEPFYLGIAFVALGFGLSLTLVRETHGHAHEEARQHRAETGDQGERLGLRAVLKRGLWQDRALFSTNQAGLVNNLNDGLAWGLFPLFFVGAGLPLAQVAVITAAYPAVWGLTQLVTGGLSDRWGRKGLIVSGMLVQAGALLEMASTRGFAPWLVGAAALGLGTAMVYPTLLAAIGDVAHPSWRGTAVGAYRLWRDGGLAIGALLAGLLADAFSIPVAVAVVGVLTLASGLLVAAVMPETLRERAG